MKRWIGMAGVLCCIFCVPATDVHAFQDGSPGSIDAGDATPRRALPVLQAVRVEDGAIDIDGRAEELAWQTTPLASDFVQFEPVEGAPATQRTEARVLYGARALFVYLHAYEPDPEAIVGQLTRRDQQSHSDILGVVIDSYFDRRTAFQPLRGRAPPSGRLFRRQRALEAQPVDYGESASGYRLEPGPFPGWEAAPNW